MSSSTLQLFQFESNEIRFVEVDGQPCIVATDLLRASDSKTTITALEAMIVEGLGGEFVSNQPLLDANNHTQHVLVLTEPAFTFYLSRSRTEAGKKLNRWIHVEVLPSIRQTGSYSVHQEPQQALPPKRDSVDFTEVHKYLSTINDLSIADLLRDKLEEDLYFSLGRQNPKAIAAAKPKEYTIGKVRARDLGYSDKQIGNGSALGRFLAKNVPVAYVQRVGKYDVKHYEVNDTLDTAIKSYFGMKALVTL